MTPGSRPDSKLSRDIMSANSNLTSLMINEEMQRPHLTQLNPLFPPTEDMLQREEQKENENSIVDQELDDRQAA